MREVSKELPSARAIAVWSGVISFAAMVGVRWYLPGSEEVLTWGRIAAATVVCSAYVWYPYLSAIFPTAVHIREKGVFFQTGSSGGLIPRERIRSIAFEDRDGLHLFVVRAATKKGKDYERAALTSPEVSDADIVKFLFDAGLADLYSGADGRRG